MFIQCCNSFIRFKMYQHIHQAQLEQLQNQNIGYKEPKDSHQALLFDFSQSEANYGKPPQPNKLLPDSRLPQAALHNNSSTLQQHEPSTISNKQHQQQDYQQNMRPFSAQNNQTQQGECRQYLLYEERVDCFGQIEQDELERYDYCIQIKREGDVFRVWEIIAEVEEDGIRGGEERARQMWREIREVESIQNVELEEEQQIIEKLQIRQVESMQQRILERRESEIREDYQQNNQKIQEIQSEKVVQENEVQVEPQFERVADQSIQNIFDGERTDQVSESRHENNNTVSASQPISSQLAQNDSSPIETIFTDALLPLTLVENSPSFPHQSQDTLKDPSTIFQQSQQLLRSFQASTSISYASPLGYPQVTPSNFFGPSQHFPIPFNPTPQIPSSPLKESPQSKFHTPLSSQISHFPQQMQHFTFTTAPPIKPPQNDSSLQSYLNLQEHPIQPNFQRQLFSSSTPNRIINTIRLILPTFDKPQQNPDEIIAQLNQVVFPQKSRYDLNVQEVRSEHRLMLNRQPDQPQRNSINSTLLKQARIIKEKPQLQLNFSYERKSVPFQEQLKFNIQRDFPKASQFQMKYLGQTGYNQDTPSSYAYKSFSFPEASSNNLPSPTWVYKQVLKQTPRMNFSYKQNEPRNSYETPNYASYTNKNYQPKQQRQQRTIPSVGKQVKISLCSPKAPKIIQNSIKNKNNFISLESPEKEIMAYRSREKTFSPNPIDNSNQNAPDSTQFNNGSPKKKKLKLVQRPKPIISLQTVVPQKQISLFSYQNLKVPRESKQMTRPSDHVHKQKIKITLRNAPKMPAYQISDESQILIEYEQHEIPINQRIH